VRYNEDRTTRNWASSRDKNILIQNGELLCGQVTKAQVGNTGGGLVHIIWKEHGAEGVRTFLSQGQGVVNNWLVLHGFTVGVSDIIARENTMTLIRSTLAKQLKKVQGIILNSQIGKLKSQPGKSMIEGFEAQVNQQLNDARDKSGNIALEDLSQHNRLRNMVQAGSKGNNINISQIMACVGQQNVEGKRIAFGFNKRTLPHFAKDDFGPESRGFVQNSYFLGLTPSELYFHAMGGREGLIDTAVKTAETGYISRRLMKALEDVMVKYDGSVRTSRDHVVQFLYGEDGVAGEQIEDMSIDLLKMDDQTVDKKYNFLSKDVDQDKLAKYFEHPEAAKKAFDDPVVAKALQDEYTSIKEDRDLLRNSIFKASTDDTVHLPINLHRIIKNAKRMFDINSRTKTDLLPTDVISKLSATLHGLCVIPGFQDVPARGAKEEMGYLRRPRDPLLVQANQDATLLLRIYLKSILNSKNVILNERLTAPSLDWILGEVKTKFEQSLVHPGEMVGSIAAQGLGEPATQMTLNTFHFAGVSAKNVTLGVPRLKEIINVSKNIKTPSLKIFLEEEYRKREQVVTKLGGMIEYTTLQHVVSSSQIFYDPNPKKTIIKADEELVALYNEIPVLEESANENLNPWVVRLELDNEKMVHKDLTITAIDKMLHDSFLDQISIMHSDENSEKLVIRMRLHGIEDEDEETAAQYLKEFESRLLNDMAVKGLSEISKVTFTKHLESEYDPKTGKL
jgi:DNA-directed RNA polymerase II subunit RPB1